MKALRALILVLALSVCAYADGNMPNGITTTPPSPSAPGNMPNGITGDTGDGVAAVTDSGTSLTTETAITETVLSLLQSVLSVF
jgi:hypothetical protein